MKKIFVLLINNVCYCLDNFYFIICMIIEFILCVIVGLFIGKFKYEVCYCLNSLYMMMLLFVYVIENLFIMFVIVFLSWRIWGIGMVRIRELYL